MKRRGFTLIELLVVIAIITLLAGLLMPAVANGRKSAREAQTASNLRQLAAAFNIYTGENSGQIPAGKVSGSADSWANVISTSGSPAGSACWYNVLPRLVGKKGAADYYNTGNVAGFYTTDNLLYCPAAIYSSTATSASQPYFAIAMNSKLNSSPCQTFVSPAQTVLFLEGGLPGETQTVSSQSSYNGQPAVYASRFIARYNGSGMIAFADGHVQLMPWQNVVSTSGKAILPQPDETTHGTPPTPDVFNPATSLGRVIWTASPNDPAGLLP